MARPRFVLAAAATAVVTAFGCSLVAGLGEYSSGTPDAGVLAEGGGAGDSNAPPDGSPSGEGGAGEAGDAGDAGAPAGDAACLPGNILDISAGAENACVVRCDGTVLCWGSDDTLQLGGDGGADTTCTADQPDGAPAYQAPCRYQPAVVPGLPSAVQVSVGYEFACAVLAGGQIECWGRNDSFQLGHTGSDFADQSCPLPAGGNVPCNPTPEPVLSLLNQKARAVVAGFDFACALMASGGVQCWGDDTHGQLGTLLDASPGSAAAIPVAGLPAAIDSIAVPADNQQFVCARATDGSMWCWGANYSGEIGNDFASNVVIGAVPVLDADGGPFAADNLRTGIYFGCSSKDGGISCWGGEQDGEFANNAILGSSPPTPASALAAALATTGSTLVDFDVRYEHAVAIDSNGTLWGWGADTFGELGAPPPVQGVDCQNVPCFATPQQIPLDAGAVVRVAVGEDISYVLTADGTLRGFGANWLGTLGHQPGTSSDITCVKAQALYFCNPAPAPIPLP